MTRTVCGVCGWDKCRCGAHPGYVIGSHWLETAYSRICAGEDEAEVLAEFGYRRCAGDQRTTQFCGLLENAVKAETARCAQVNEDAARQYDAAMRHYWNSGLDAASRALRNAAADMRKGAA